MKHQKIHDLGKDGIRLFAQVWEPTQEVGSVIARIHGLGEHSSRYQRVAEILCAIDFRHAQTRLDGLRRDEQLQSTWTK